MKKRIFAGISAAFMAVQLITIPTASAEYNKGWEISYSDEGGTKTDRDSYYIEISNEYFVDGEYGAFVSYPDNAVEGDYAVLENTLTQNLPTGSYTLKFYANRNSTSPGYSKNLIDVRIGDNTFLVADFDMSAESVIGMDGRTYYEYSKTFDYTEQTESSLQFVIHGRASSFRIDNVSLLCNGNEYISQGNFETEDDGTVKSDSYKWCQYQPENFFINPGQAGVYSVSWINPSEKILSKINIYRVTEDGNVLIEEIEPNLEAGKTQAHQFTPPSGEVPVIKGEFVFTDGRIIQMYSTRAASTLWDANPAGGWYYGYNFSPDGTGQKYVPMRAVVDTVEKHSGEAALKIENNMIGSVSYTYPSMHSDSISFEGGKKYKISLWIKSENTTGAVQLHLGGSLFDGKGNVENGALGTYDWKEFEYTFSPNENISKPLSLAWTSGTKSFWIDDVSVYELDENDEITGDNLINNGDVERYTMPSGNINGITAESGVQSVGLQFKNDSGYNLINLYEKVDGEYAPRGFVPSGYKGVVFDGLRKEREYTFAAAGASFFGAEAELFEATAVTDMESYEILAPYLKAGALSAGQNVLVLEVKNNKLEDGLPIEVMLGIYKDNTLENLYSQKTVLNKTSASSASSKIEMPFTLDAREGYSVRALVWDSRELMNSYIDQTIFQ